MRSRGRLDTEQLKQSVACLLGAGIATLMARLYRSGYAWYWKFCVSARALPFQRQNGSCCCLLLPSTMLNSLMPPSSVTCWRYSTFRFAMAIVTRSLLPPATKARAAENQEAKRVAIRPGRLPRYTGGAQNLTSSLVSKGFRF